jgi:hypothetical protein
LPGHKDNRGEHRLHQGEISASRLLVDNSKRDLLVGLATGATMVASLESAGARDTRTSAHGQGAGGASPLSIVRSLSALATLNPTQVNAVYLTSNPNSGFFVWQSGNYETQITNDPGQGIYAAWSGDNAPGATGAWVRQYSGAANLSWWGAVGDRVTVAANSTALANFGTWARYQSTALGYGVDVVVQPGMYLFDNAHCQRWLAGISQLHMKGYGATFQNVTANASWKLGWELAALPIFPDNAWLINGTTVGATSFRVSTPANTANLSVGQLVMLGSLDIQYYGYPPNMYQFEVLRITSINSTTGVVGVDRPIRYDHLTTFPDNITSVPCGAARVWQLNIEATINGVAVNPVTFDVAHVYEGLTILGASNGGQPDLTMTGRSITWRNATVNGIAPSIASEVNLINCKIPGFNEPDKLVESLTIDGCEIFGNLGFQSNSIDRVLIRGGKISGTLTTGGKICSVQGAEIERLIPGGASFGVSTATIIDGCTVRQYTPPGFAAGATNFSFNTTAIPGASAWITSSTTITTGTGNPGAIGPGMVVYDLTTSQQIGLVASWVGTTLTLQAAAAFASAGSADILQFGSVPAASSWTTSSMAITMGASNPGSVILAATSSWTTSSTTITMSGSNPGPITAGASVFDQTTGQSIGTVSSWSGTTLTLQAAAAHAGSGGDSLLIGKGSVFPGELIYDATTSKIIGMTSSWIGTALTLRAAAAFASSGSRDLLQFGSLYANGVITMSLADVTNMQPGAVIQLGAASQFYPGDIGAGIVQSITGDANYMYVQTSFSFPSLPAWASGKAYIQRRPRFDVRSSTGCDAIRRAARATEVGLQEGQWIEDTFLGQGSRSGYWKPFGIPISITVTVAKACSVASTTFMIYGALNSAANPAAAQETISLVIDLTHVGTRVVNQRSFTGILGADALTHNSATAGAIPAGVVCNGATLSWQFSYEPSSLTQQQLPVVEVEMKFDTGLWGRFFTADHARRAR